jgi:exosortase/archaeosortase family protein
MHLKDRIFKFLNQRSRLDLFLIKSGILVLAYYIIRIVFKFTFLKPVFIFFRKLLTQIILKVSYFFLDIFGYDVNIYKRIIWIEGSQGVRVINACLGWSMMALFIGFILIYPGKRKPKYWYVPMGLVIIQFANIIRITAMVLVSFHQYDLMDFYHKYIFNFFLYLVVFVLWIIWVRKYSNEEADTVIINP